MRALTIWQPWASLIIAGAKPFEFRRWCAPSWATGQQIVIHAGTRRVKRDEIEELIFEFEMGGNPGALDPVIVLPATSSITTRHFLWRIDTLPLPHRLCHRTGAAVMRAKGQPFFFLPLLGFADPEAVLAARTKGPKA